MKNADDSDRFQSRSTQHSMHMFFTLWMPTANVSTSDDYGDKKKISATHFAAFLTYIHSTHYDHNLWAPKCSSGRLWYENKNFNSTPYPVCLYAMYYMFSTNLYCVIVCFLCSVIPRFVFSLASLKCGGSSCFHQNCNACNVRSRLLICP